MHMYTSLPVMRYPALALMEHCWGSSVHVFKAAVLTHAPVCASGGAFKLWPLPVIALRDLVQAAIISSSSGSSIIIGGGALVQ